MATRAKRGSKTLKAAAAKTPEVSSSTPMEGFAQMTQPKLQLFGLHSRYANALFSIASKEKKLDAVELELKSIQLAITSNADFGSFLNDPTIACHHKKKSISGIMSEMKVSKQVAGLFSVLAENGRLGESLKVIGTFDQLMRAHRGEVAAIVTSADVLTSAQMKLVEATLKEHIDTGETLMLETKVDPTILGGLRVQIGNKYIDLSLSTKIDKLHSMLSQPVV